MSERTDDEGARARSLDPERSFIVQAPAGSGKTGLLLQRFLALIPTVREPEEIVAITFTRKAAAEIRTRIVRALFEPESITGQSPYATRTRALAAAARAHTERAGWHLREAPRRLQARTIDSYCEGIARSHPLASGLGAGLQTVDHSGQLLEEAARRVLREETPALERTLVHVDNDCAYLRHLVVRMLAARDQWLRHLRDGDPAAVRAELEDGLARAVASTLERARRAFPARTAEALLPLARFAGENARRLDSNRAIALLADLRAFPEPRPEALEYWRAFGALLLKSSGDPRKTVNRNVGFPAAADAEDAAQARSMKQDMTALLADLSREDSREIGAALGEATVLPEPRYSDAQWQRVQDLTELMRSAVSHLRRVFEEKGEVDHPEVLLAAARVVERGGLRSLPRHLLVDEFQDTSMAQYRLISALFAESDGRDGRTLFLVGDPMQSIYRFREAEVGIFLHAWRGRLGSVHLESLTLHVNFRSLRGVVEAVNEIFARALPAVADPERGHVPYTHFVAHAEEAGEGIAVDAWLDPHPEAEAHVVIERAREALAARQSVALLARTRDHAALILERLREAAIPCQAVDFIRLAERPVVRDLRALVTALLFPADRLAWLAILRAQWCGLSLADLHALAAEDDRPVPEIIADEAALARLTPDGQHRAKALAVVLDSARTARQRGGFARTLRSAWLRLAGPAAGDAAQCDDAEAFFDLVAEVESCGEIADLALLDRRLGSLFARRSAAVGEAVQVMTIHKSKGLEFDCVIVPGLARFSRAEPGSLLIFHERVAFGTESGALLLAPIPERRSKNGDSIYEYLRHTERQRNAVEIQRLLYVALTRARRRVHLLGHLARGHDGEVREPDARSALAGIWGGVRERFLERAAQRAHDAPDPPRERATQPPILRFPADWRPPAPAPDACARREELEEAAASEDVIAFTAGLRAQVVGSVMHRLLERIARDGVSAWNKSRFEREQGAIRAALVGHGLGAEDCDAAGAEIEAMVQRMLADERGLWILAPHPNAECEMAFACMEEGRVEHVRIDRTFLDAGVRWIIDYKSSQHEGAERAEFLRAESLRHMPQLLRYRRLFETLEPERPVRAGLYFVRYAHFEEVA